MISKVRQHSSEDYSTLPMKKRPRRKAKVSFGRASCRLFKVDLTEAEKSRIWYKAEEYKKIQANIHADLRDAVNAQNKKYYMDNETQGQELCVRGLESLLSGPTHSKRQRRRRFNHYFLHTHRYMGVTDPYELSSLAIHLSGHDPIRAYHMAEYDAYEAYTVHNESRSFHSHNMEALEEYNEFDNVPKATNLCTRSRGGERTIVPPIA